MPFALAMFFCSIGSCHAVTAQSQHSALDLLHLSYQASGGNKWDSLAQIEQSGTVVVGGISGTFHQIIDPRDGKDITEFEVGPLRGKEATLTDSTWELDQSGLATVHDGPEARANAQNQCFINRRGWLHVSEDELRSAGRRQEAGSIYDLVSVTPHNGRPLTLWLDARDHLLKRIVQEDANHQQIITYLSDYKQTSGILYPFTIRESNGNESQDTVKTAQTVRFSPVVNQAAFAVPASNFNDAHLLNDKDFVEIPFQIADGRIVLDVSINGHSPLPFLLDTGGQNYITPEAAALVGIQGSGNFALSGGGSQQENVNFAGGAEMRIGQLDMRNQIFIVGKLPAFVQDRGGQAPLAGLVGYELLRRFPATFNYQKKILTFYRPGSMVKTPSGGQSLRLYFEGRNPFIEVSVDGVRGYFGIDTGDRSVTTIFKPFYNAHQFPVIQPALERRQGGIGGLERALLTRVAVLSFGEWTLHSPLVNLTLAGQGAFSSEFDAGNIGYETLRNFVFTLDYEHHRILLEKSAEFGRNTPYNRSGMTLQRNASGKVEVQTITPGTPAAHAGLKIGDTIVSINAEKPEGKALYDFERVLFGSTGTMIGVHYQRSGIDRHAEFKLRELLRVGAAMHPITVN